MKNERLVGLFEDINDQIYDCDTVQINDDCEIHRYVLKDGSTFEIPAFNTTSKTLEMIKPLHEAFNRELPKNSTELAEFCGQILENLQALLVLKEFVRYTNFHQHENRIKGLDDDVVSASSYVNNLLCMAADLAPLWWGEKAPKYPELSYNDENPNNILGWDHKRDYLIFGAARNVIYERTIMHNIASSYKPTTGITENELIGSIREFRTANMDYYHTIKKYMK